MLSPLLMTSAKNSYVEKIFSSIEATADVAQVMWVDKEVVFKINVYFCGFIYLIMLEMSVKIGFVAFLAYLMYSC